MKLKQKQKFKYFTMSSIARDLFTVKYEKTAKNQKSDENFKKNFQKSSGGLSDNLVLKNI